MARKKKPEPQPTDAPAGTTVNVSPLETPVSATMTAAQAWTEAVRLIEVRIDRPTFAMTLAEADLTDYRPETGTYIVTVKNEFARASLQGRLYRFVVNNLRGLHDGSFQVEFIVGGV